MNVCILMSGEGLTMTKDKFVYELIDKCMLITCQDNIMAENFALRDDTPYYEENERQFRECLKFYEDMNELLKRGEITETMMDQELCAALALIRQRALQQFLGDFQQYLYQIRHQDVDSELEALKWELQSGNITSDFILKKIKYYRKNEIQGKQGTM